MAAEEELGQYGDQIKALVDEYPVARRTLSLIHRAMGAAMDNPKTLMSSGMELGILMHKSHPDIADDIMALIVHGREIVGNQKETESLQFMVYGCVELARALGQKDELEDEHE